jgi:curved DNA-binding protein CbpA
VQDLYELLEVAPTASAEVITAALTAQRRTWMQRQSAPTMERRQEAEQMLARLAEAERTLLDPTARAQYDAQHSATPPTHTNPAPAPAPNPAPQPAPTPTPAPAAAPATATSGLDWPKTAKILNIVIIVGIVIGSISLLAYRRDTSTYNAYDDSSYDDDTYDNGSDTTTYDSGSSGTYSTNTTPPTTTEPTTPSTDTVVTAPPPSQPAIEARVSRSCGASGSGDCFLSVRTAATSNSPELRRLFEGETTTVVCQVTGESVRSSVLGVPTSVWVRDSSGNYMSAAFLDAPGLDPFTVSIPC